jgi:hypothetical protein
MVRKYSQILRTWRIANPSWIVFQDLQLTHETVFHMEQNVHWVTIGVRVLPLGRHPPRDWRLRPPFAMQFKRSVVMYLARSYRPHLPFQFVTPREVGFQEFLYEI